MKIKLLFLVFVLFHFSFSQWSTSTYADSALYVCPGFNQGILTFDDGSSIICGALNDYRFVQKLDPFGYKIWQQPVQVYYTPGTNNDGNAMQIISDGEGGVILWWNDYRGATYKIYELYSMYFNNAVYMQHVDKYGNILWQPGGIQVNSVNGGRKGGYGITDGQGGIILYLEESFYDTSSGTFLKDHSWLVRYDGNGQNIWLKEIDTSTVQYQISIGQPTRLGNKIMIGTLSGFRFYYTDGNTTPIPQFIPGSMLLLKDSIAFRIELKPTLIDSAGNTVYTYGATRISTSWDSLWYTEFKIIDETDTYGFYSVGNPYISDNQDGFYDVWRLQDKSGDVTTRAQWITKSGPKWGNGDFVISKKSAIALFNGTNKLGLFFSDGTAELFDSTGKAQWDTNNVVISDLDNATGPVFASDNNGGCIITYWTTLGGIYAQQTGRAGKVGIITKVPTSETVPLKFELSQNYPNPFNPTTTIRFSINHNSNIILKIYDILGREVATLINKNLLQGRYEIVWSGESNASGVYFYTLSSGSNTITKKMLLLR